MTWALKNRITTGLFVAGIALLLGLAAAAVVFGLRTISYNERLHGLQQEYALAHGILQSLVDAETGVRGYLITGDPAYLEPYHAGLDNLARLRAEAEHTEAAMLFGPQAATDKDLASMITQRQSVMQNLIDTVQQEGVAAAQKDLAEGPGKRLTDEIRRQIGLIDQKIAMDSERIADQVETGAQFLSGLLSGSMGLAILMSSAQFWLFRREIRQRGAVEVHLQEQHRQIALLSRLADSLHASNSRAESYQMIEAFAQELLAGDPGQPTSGCLYVYNHSRDQLARVASWGAGETLPGVAYFMPDDCWGLRRGKLHLGSAIAGQIDCPHVKGQSDSLPYLCLPITARGQSSGLLYLEARALTDPLQRARWLELVGHFADQLSLALVNIELRERLENMAIRDALTDLYNRRFMDEALARELLLAQRNESKLAIALMDIDHFKKMNDTYGHQAGDEVLKQVARYLNAAIRRSDFVCRYGGEELMLLLPGCDLAEGVAKAEEIRNGIASLPLSMAGQSLPFITISIGVAAYPLQGQSASELLAQADHALYEAKRTGRNRVMAPAALPSAAK
jgi:diguanylate cyclase (GGDEF)-like protein